METATLERLGLSKQQSSVYLATLALGSSPISDIAKKAGIKRPTTYYIIDELVEKNLISRVPKGKRTFYVAEPPQNLLKNIRAQEEMLMNLLPSLELLQKSAPNKPHIRFYEGKEAIFSAYKDMFKTHHKVMAIGSMKHIINVYSYDEIGELFKILSREGGKFYDLVDKGEETKAYIKIPHRKGAGPFKYLPDDFKIGTDTIIAGNKVLLVSYSAMVAVVIENEQIAQTQQQLFEFLWKRL